MTILIALIAVAGAAAQPAGGCKPSAATSHRIVADFYREALIDRHPKAAFQRYMAPDFIEHKPDVATPTRNAIGNYLDQVIKSLPGARWEVLRAVSEGDMVVLHVRFAPAPGAPPYAIADFFRLKNCKIVEHWDVVAGPPKEQRNPEPRF